MIPEFLKNFTKKFFPYLSITLYLLDFLNQRELLFMTLNKFVNQPQCPLRS